MSKKSRASLLLSTGAWKTILLDASGRQEIEACGALLGRIDGEGNWCVEEAYPLSNSCPSPVYFEFDPVELLTIDLEQPGRMIGVYHSHPAGPALASSTDRRNMQRVNVEQQIPWVWLIVSGPFSTTPVSDSEEVTISVRGVVAYHHYPDVGLQKIAIQHHGDEPT
jgi:proteasome lid subunit RPN8/RPN11